MSFSASAYPAVVSLYDARPFFEKALQFGVQHSIIPTEKLAAICADAPKGMLQITRYFDGSKFLRPDLEQAKDRIVNLVSLYLESISGGDLRLAAESLRDRSFLSHSKGGSDMLKALFALPAGTSFETESSSDISDKSKLTETEWLADWSLKSFADYRAELVQRRSLEPKRDAVIWLIKQLGLGSDKFKDLYPHPVEMDAIIRTALLMFSTKSTKFPDWTKFKKMIGVLRTRNRSAKARAAVRAAKTGNSSTKPWAFSVVIPKNLPEDLMTVVDDVQQSVVADLPKILNSSLSARRLFARDSEDDHPPLDGRYSWLEDIASEMHHHEHSVSRAWDKVTGGNCDDDSLLTLFVCVAAGAAPKTVLTEKAAAALVRKLQKPGSASGFKPELAGQYIVDHAPSQHQKAYLELWADFVEEAGSTLQSDSTYARKDALALLRRECHVTA